MRKTALVSFLVLSSLMADPMTETKTALTASEKAEDKVKSFVTSKLLPLSTNAVFVAEVKKQNSLGTSLDEIKRIDQEWQAAEDFLPIQEKVMDNACAKEIINIIKGLPVIKEAFVMDNQGAVVGENDLTSDYWQGDEAKWKNSFNEGKGGVDVGKVKFDKSANAHLQQISIPVISDGKAIGAITFGLDINKL